MPSIVRSPSRYVCLGWFTLLLLACGGASDDSERGGGADVAVFDVQVGDLRTDGSAERDSGAEDAGDGAATDADRPEVDALDGGVPDAEASDALEADTSEPDAAGPDTVTEVRFDVVTIRASVEGDTLPVDATFDVVFELPVSAATSWGSATNGVCSGSLALVDLATERCVGVRTSNVDERTLRLAPRRPLRSGASLALRVTDAVEGPAGERVRPAEEVFEVEREMGPPASRTIVLDGENDFLPTERIGGLDLDIFATWDDEHFYIGVDGADLTLTNQAVYVVAGTRHDTDSLGAAFVPEARWFEGSTTLLPFHASHLFFAKTVGGEIERYQRRHEGVAWSARTDAGAAMEVVTGPSYSELAIERSALGGGRTLDLAVYVKDLGSNCGGTCEPGWGWLYAANDASLIAGPGDRILSRFWRASFDAPAGVSGGTEHARFGRSDTRLEVYQLLVRTFGNINETRVPNGTLAENGTGRFDDLNPAAAAALADMGMTHVWFTGALQQATSTDWSEVGEPADDPDILKGRAGSPYAIRDYFDVAPDYAVDPAARHTAFRAAVSAMHAEGLDVLLDFVPNHVARSYASSVRPERSFGAGDRTDVFYTRDNHFFYLQVGDAPTQMPGFDRATQTPISPTCSVLAATAGDYQCDGLYDWTNGGETDWGRVTGNNVASWSPDLGSWYETVKLNYGFDYTTGAFEHPAVGAPEAPIPRTWEVMDEVIAHWQSLGVDGFRVDMAHMVPMAFHEWLISRSRARDPNVFWMAEAYDTDPAKVTEGNVLHALLGAGYDAVYDDDTYDRLKAVFDGNAWANDVDNPLIADPILTHHALRYAENHDEVRLASPHDWMFDGANVGRAQAQAITAMLFAIGRGPVMVYAGQETGESAEGAEGFGGDDGRTSIFDYWSMPSFVGWVNSHAYDGGGLDAETAALRAQHLETWAAFRDPVFAQGQTYLLNGANLDRPRFGRLEGEPVSGRYAHALLRYVDGRAALVFVWLHPTITATDVAVRVPADAWDRVGFGDAPVALRVGLGVALDAPSIDRDALNTEGVALGDIEPGGVRVVYLER